MSYVDGFVVPVPRERVADYRRLARKAGRIWREHGALHYVECVAEDVQPGKLTSFPQAVKLKPDEVVVFSWIVYRSRRERDRINKAVTSVAEAEGYDLVVYSGVAFASKKVDITDKVLKSLGKK